MRISPFLAACFVLAASPVVADDLAFTLINDSSAALVEFYVSPRHQDTWGEDLVSGSPLAAGTEGTVTIADGEAVCDYDLQFVMDNGADPTVVTQNLCELATFTLHD